MADEQTTRSISRQQQREFRRVVANAVTELRSAEIRNSFAALSIEELIDQHIDRLEGTSGGRASRLQRIRTVRQELADNIEAMKATSPSDFRRHDPDGDANTAPDAED